MTKQKFKKKIKFWKNVSVGLMIVGVATVFSISCQAWSMDLAFFRQFSRFDMDMIEIFNFAYMLVTIISAIHYENLKYDYRHAYPKESSDSK